MGPKTQQLRALRALSVFVGASALTLVFGVPLAPASHYIAGVSGDELGIQPAAARPWFDVLGLEASAAWFWWEPGKASLSAYDRARAQNVLAVARRPFAVISGRAAREPRSNADRAEFCSIAAELARIGIRDFILPNEPDIADFFAWRRHAASNTVLLLATCYPKLHRLGARVWGVNPVSLSYPLPFIERVGHAYRRLLKTRKVHGRLMDGFGFHPYPKAGETPWVRHSDGMIGIADVKQLRRAICRAFRRTPQGCRMPILYTEAGVTHPGGAQSFIAFPDPIGWVAAAHQLASRQRGVVGLLTFQLWDDYGTSGGAWQSGLLYSNREPKPGIERLPQALAQIRARKAK